jgi:hypothetical protein
MFMPLLFVHRAFGFGPRARRVHRVSMSSRAENNSCPGECEFAKASRIGQRHDMRKHRAGSDAGVDFSFSRLNDAPMRRGSRGGHGSACSAAAARPRTDDSQVRCDARRSYVVYRTEVHFPAD